MLCVREPGEQREPPARGRPPRHARARGRAAVARRTATTVAIANGAPAASSSAARANRLRPGGPTSDRWLAGASPRSSVGECRPFGGVALTTLCDALLVENPPDL